MPKYIKLKDVLHILDVVMSDPGIKHKGKAIRKRLKELPTIEVKKSSIFQYNPCPCCGSYGVEIIEKEGIK